MLRLLIGTGILLMAVGFGAAGWQHWQARQPVPASSDMDAGPGPVTATGDPAWLIAPSGGLVPRETARAYLLQDRYVPDRTARITLGARLVELLAEGEKLPEPAYLQVLADIRAPELGKNLCAALTAAMPVECAVNQARVVGGSVDAAAGTAVFAIELVFRETAAGADLPDLAEHVLQEQPFAVDLAPGEPGSESAAAALTAAANIAGTACATEGLDKHCRIGQLSVDWMPGQTVTLRGRVAWLAPLPQGMFAAPPLQDAIGG